MCVNLAERTLKVFVVAEENPKFELARLHRAQRQAREDEVYGGLSRSERAEYDRRAGRINQLEIQLQNLASTDKARAEERREWNKQPETDTPQREGRQPYRSREKDSTNASTDSSKSRRTKKKPSPEDGRE